MSLDNFVPNLTRPRSDDQLAKALGIATDIYRYIVDCKDSETLYRRHLIPKRAREKLPQVPVQGFSGVTELKIGGHDLSNYRVAWEPHSSVVRFAHRSAARVLGRFFSRPEAAFPHPCAYGYIKGRSTRQNAQRHVGAKCLLSADIRDFFPSISIGRVEIALESAGINPAVCGSLAKFLTIDGSLPLGLNSSPLIANLVAAPLDHDLEAIARAHRCVYTRYADDITISGPENLPARVVIEDVLKKHRFRLNGAKFRTSKRGQRHYVTGLSVADRVAPHAPRKMKRRLRQELYFIDKYGFDGHLMRSSDDRSPQHSVNRIDGLVNYVASIEIRNAASLRTKWLKLCEANDIERSFEPRPMVNLRRAHWFVDEAEITHPSGVTLLAVCLADVLDLGRLDPDLIALFAQEAGDAFGTKSGVEIARKGLHWAEATWSQREVVVKHLATSPIRAMVAIGVLGSSESYSDTYSRLLGKLLETSLKTADDAAVSMLVEENRSKVANAKVHRVVEDVYSQLEKDNQRRPVSLPNVQVVPKGFSPSMCVPDVLLGVLARYAQSRPDGEDAGLAVSLFERLRDRYLVIFDEHSNRVYHSRNPFRRW